MTTWALRPAVRVRFALLMVGMFAASYTQPLWVTHFSAPQYPNGLRLQVYMDHVGGDVQEVNELNHYVGMPGLDTMATFERSIAFGALILGCGSALLAATFQKSAWQMLFIFPLVIFPIVMLIDLHAWQWYAGHSLAPDAPLSMTVKPFTPKLVGTQKVGNFVVTSSLGLGTYLQFAGALLLAAAATVGWRLSKKHDM